MKHLNRKYINVWDFYNSPINVKAMECNCHKKLFFKKCRHNFSKAFGKHILYISHFLQEKKLFFVILFIRCHSDSVSVEITLCVTRTSYEEYVSIKLMHMFFFPTNLSIFKNGQILKFIEVGRF